MFILGLGTAAPAWRYTQRECWEFARSADMVRQLTPRSQAILKKVLLGENGISSRHLAVAALTETTQASPDALHQRFARFAPELAAKAALRALESASLNPNDIDALLISTCTGYLCPGLTSYVSERLGLQPNCLLLDLVGQGCGAALPNLRTAEALLTARRAQHVLSICVEICSAAFFLDNDPGVLISACLFGDGAGAAVLANAPSSSGRAVEWKSAGTFSSPTDRDYLRFEQRDGMLRNILSRQVPELAGKCAALVAHQVLSAVQIDQARINTWIVHSGGREILRSLQERLRLSEEDLAWSAGVLNEYGNLSSPNVFFVLEAALAGGAPNGYWWMTSFGAGFSCHGALLEVRGGE